MFLILFVLFGCGSPGEAGPGAEVAHAEVDLDDPRACGACHGAVVEEWESSMHSRAHPSRDPIYQAMLTLRIEKQGPEIGAQCPACHSPRSPADPDAAAGLKGVSCAACHAVSSVDRSRGPGAKALLRGEALLGARDLAPGASPVHGTGAAAPFVADGQTLCLACHDATSAPSGVAACTTGPEFAEAKSGESCVDCHMPRVKGASGAVSDRPDHPSHAFLGPHGAWAEEPGFLASAVDFSVALGEGTATVTLVNRAGHAYPTGLPGRMGSVIVRGLDASGGEVWTSLGADGAPGPDALLNKVYHDALGKPVASPFAQTLARDNRLKPGETRAISFEVPPGVVRVEAELRFFLLAPRLAETLGLAGTPEARPQVVARAEARLP